MTIDELNNLPVGTHVRDRFGSKMFGANDSEAHWVKHEDGSWHLIEQPGSEFSGTDWSGPYGDTVETVALELDNLEVIS